MRRPAPVRFASALLLFLYGAGQPAVLCTVDCLLGRHVATYAAHASHHHNSAPAQPCHTGQLTAGNTIPQALTAIAEAPTGLRLAISVGPTSDNLPTVSDLAPPSRTPALDTPPPKRLIA